MPLRYSKVLRRCFQDILHMQRIGLLDADTDEKLQEYLYTHRKALRELHRLTDKFEPLTIQGVHVPGAWNNFFADWPAVSDDFGDGIK